MYYLVPTLVDEKFYDGEVIQVLPRCKLKYDKSPCLEFYKKLSNSPEGFYVCPSGCTVYHKVDNGKQIYYFGLLVKKHFNKKTYIHSTDDAELTVVQENVFLGIIHQQEKISRLENDLKQSEVIRRDLFHDVRKLDSLIKSKSDALVRECEQNGGVSHEILNRIKNINAMSEIIACKYSVYDLVSNIGVLSMGASLPVNIYRKFDKVRYILKDYKNKNVTIFFDGETTYEYAMNIGYADILPFLLLENAVKYTIGDHDIQVKFEEENDSLFVTIISFGPYCEESEYNSVFLRNYRGCNTLNYSSEGTGIGLYLVKEICNQFNIDISISSDFVKYINGVKCGFFKVNLIF